MEHSNDELRVAEAVGKSKAGDWFTELEWALEHDAPDLVLSIAQRTLAERGESLTELERKILKLAVDRASSRAMPHTNKKIGVAEVAGEPKADDWFADMERALEHDTPELVLKIVDEIYVEHGDKLKDDERSFLERARRWAEEGIKLRNERWPSRPSQEKDKG